MPLRVAEKDGYFHAVNRCVDCPFMEQIKETAKVGRIWGCGRYTGKEVLGTCIPVWCPLPTGQNGSGVITEEKFHSLLDEVINHILTTVSPKTMTEFMVRHENAEEAIKMRGRHPENIIWDEPPTFIVRVVEGRGSDTFIEIEPALASGPDWTYLRKGDCLIAGKGERGIRCWVRETPSSSRVKVTLGGPLKIGALLTALGPGRETKPLKEDKPVKKLRIGEHLPGKER